MKIPPNFIRVDQEVVIDNKITVWTSADYEGEYPFTIYNALGYPIQSGSLKGKNNVITLDKDTSSGIYMMRVDKRTFPFLKVG